MPCSRSSSTRRGSSARAPGRRCARCRCHRRVRALVPADEKPRGLVSAADPVSACTVRRAPARRRRRRGHGDRPVPRPPLLPSTTCDAHPAATRPASPVAFAILEVPMIAHPPARHLLRAKDLIDARYREPLDVPALARRCPPLHRALQPRVPQGVRRDAAPVPAHPPARARGGAAPQHRPDGVGDLLHRGPAERRVVHVELRTRPRLLAPRLSGRVSTGNRSGPDPDVHAARLRAAQSSSFGEDSRLRP